MKWVANIWVSIPCTAGTPFRRINEKLGAETGDLALTCKLVDAAVGLCRRVVRIGDGFSWKWSNGNKLWKLVVVRNLFARCGSSSCLVSTAAAAVDDVTVLRTPWGEWKFLCLLSGGSA